MGVKEVSPCNPQELAIQKRTLPGLSAHPVVSSEDKPTRGGDEKYLLVPISLVSLVASHFCIPHGKNPLRVFQWLSSVELYLDCTIRLRCLAPINLANSAISSVFSTGQKGIK